VWLSVANCVCHVVVPAASDLPGMSLGFRKGCGGCIVAIHHHCCPGHICTVCLSVRSCHKRRSTTAGSSIANMAKPHAMQPQCTCVCDTYGPSSALSKLSLWRICWAVRLWLRIDLHVTLAHANHSMYMYEAQPMCLTAVGNVLSRTDLVWPECVFGVCVVWHGSEGTLGRPLLQALAQWWSLTPSGCAAQPSALNICGLLAAMCRQSEGVKCVWPTHSLRLMISILV
jgi:hypothetical protein